MALFVDGVGVHAADLNGNLPVLLGSSVLLATAASIPLTIPAGYNRIKVYWRARASDANPAEQLFLQINGDTANDYLWENNQANNAGAVSGTTSGAAVAKIQVGTIPAASATALYFGSGEFTIDGASDTTNYKTVSGFGSAFASTTNMWAGMYGGQWNSAAAVASLQVFGGIGSLVAGSSLSAYGLM